MTPEMVGLGSVVLGSVSTLPQGVGSLSLIFVRTKPSPKPRATIQAMMRKMVIMIRRPCDTSFDLAKPKHHYQYLLPINSMSQ